MQHVPKRKSENGAFSSTGYSEHAQYPLAAKYS